MESRRAILVIEDEESVVESLRWIFADRYEVQWAASLNEVVREMRRNDVAAIVADLKLNGKQAQGDTLIAYVRGYYPRIPVIVHSGFLEAAQMQKMLEWGVRSFLSKTCDTNHLIFVIEGEIAAADKALSDARELKQYREKHYEPKPIRWAKLQRLARRASEKAVRYSRPIAVGLGVAGAAASYVWSEWLSEWFKWR